MDDSLATRRLRPRRAAHRLAVMSGNDAAPRRPGATRVTLLTLLGLAVVGGAGWRLLRPTAEHKATPQHQSVAAAAPTRPAPLAETASGAGAPVVVQAPGVAGP